MDRATILKAFGLLSERLHERGADGELNVVCGTAMVLLSPLARPPKT
jgi:hypothetical protein